MDIQENRPKGTTMQKSSEVSKNEIPVAYSRQKSIKLVRENNIPPVPQSGARRIIYLMLLKIGATGELPQEKELRESFLNDFWRVMYFDNHYCPGDIPFTIVMDMFTDAMVQGTAERKGNNQAAICQAFNKWVTIESVRHKLYQKRDEMYPHKKPKQISENATPETIADYSDEELIEKLKSIKPMAGLKMVNRMIEELEKEVENRGIKTQ